MAQDKNPKQGQGALRADQMRLIAQQGFSFSGYERDLLCLNLGTGKYLDVSGISGIDSISDGRAAVFADFDNDGDLDVFLTTIQGDAHLLFRNNIGQANNFLRIVLEGSRELGRDAYGAVVRLRTSAGTMTKIKSGGSGFIAQHEPASAVRPGVGGACRMDRGVLAQWESRTVPGRRPCRLDAVAARRSRSPPKCSRSAAPNCPIP